MMDRRRFWLIPMLMGGLLLPVPADAQVPPPPGDALLRASTQVAQGQQAPQATASQGVSPGTNVTAPPADATQQAATQNAASTAAAAADVQAASNELADSAAQTSEATEALAAALAEEAARAAANADANRVEAERKMNDRAFNSAQRGLFPLTPEQIKQIMSKMEETQNAATPPSYGQPKPEVAVNTISLDPGATPPEVQVAVGYVTTLTILDATGQPWPIVDIGVGGNFDIPTPESNSHIIRITPMSRFGYGNLSVRLKDLTTPVTFRLSAGNDTVHYRYDARIPANGPNARASLIQRTKVSAGDDVIMAVLDNAVPSGAKKYKVNGTDTRTSAYKVGERMFVRTPLSMLSPSWDASVSSADGMTVYEVGDTPVLLLSDNGQMVRVRLTEQAIQ